MKAIGIVRKLDALGRIVIPAETREIFGMDEGTPLEIYITGHQIILQRYTPGCQFCDGAHALAAYRGKFICGECLAHLRRLGADDQSPDHGSEQARAVAEGGPYWPAPSR